MKINDELIENLVKDKSGLHQENTKNLTKTLKDPNTSQKTKKEIRELFRRLYK